MPLPIRHILLADDDQDDILLFETAAQEACPDLELTVADNGLQLISLLDEINTPDAIFLDLNMPFKSGKECLKEIRSKHQFDNVPVIILSTSNHKSDIDYCLSKGANHYFTKPNSYKGLKEIVVDLCDGKLTA